MNTERFSLLARSVALASVVLFASCNLQDPLTDWKPTIDARNNGSLEDAANNGALGDAGNNGVDEDAANNGVSDDAANNGVPDTGGDEDASDGGPEPRCGDGVVGVGELCDGNCPTCDDGDPCTTDIQAGSPATCDVVCSNDPVTACVDGDACCPGACTSDTDQDCPCIPTTCADAGRLCGELPDGCGQTLTCGTCPAEESCLAGACQASLGVGDGCPQGAGCPQTGACITEDNAGWPNGYCSLACTGGDADCPPGTHCEADFQACVQSCTDDSECNPGYGCFDYTGAASDPRQDGRTECLPVGTGNMPIGASCTSASDCSTGQGATCIRGWEDGYCSFKCSMDTDCPSGSHCSGQNFGGVGDCFQSCTSDTDCREPGYVCDDLSGDGRTECMQLPVCPTGWTGPRCNVPDCTVPTIPTTLEDPYCTAGFCKDETGACLRLVDNPWLARANTNSACIPAVCCESPQVTGNCNDGFCNDGTQCISLATNPQYARDPNTTGCIQVECGLDCDEPGGGCNPGFCFDGNSGCLWLTTYTELQRGAAGQCLPLACP